MADSAIKAFERGTPAGNALHKLYGGKKSMDSTLDPVLLKQIQKMRAAKEAQEQPKVPVVPKSRAHVNVPRLRGKATNDVLDEFRRMPWYAFSRKPEHVIKKELRDVTPGPAPMPKGPLITDKDKLKLEQIMEFGEVLPEGPVVRRQPQKATERDRCLKLFNDIVKEIEERKEFMAEMEAQGRHKEFALKINGEISERIDELRKLDKILRSLPDE
jgi:hypothetical protein